MFFHWHERSCDLFFTSTSTSRSDDYRIDFQFPLYLVSPMKTGGFSAYSLLETNNTRDKIIRSFTIIISEEAL